MQHPSSQLVLQWKVALQGAENVQQFNFYISQQCKISCMHVVTCNPQLVSQSSRQCCIASRNKKLPCVTTPLDFCSSSWNKAVNYCLIWLTTYVKIDTGLHCDVSLNRTCNHLCPGQFFKI